MLLVEIINHLGNGVEEHRYVKYEQRKGAMKTEKERPTIYKKEKKKSSTQPKGHKSQDL